MRTRRQKRFLQRDERLGFSFLEIMMVVMIIGILVAVVGQKMLGRTEKARIQPTLMQIRDVKMALNGFDMNVGALPTTDHGLAALVRRPSDVPEDQWEAQMEELPRDAWHEPFIYRCPGEGEREYDLFSKGKDRKEGTEDDIDAFREENLP